MITGHKETHIPGTSMGCHWERGRESLFWERGSCGEDSGKQGWMLSKSQGSSEIGLTNNLCLGGRKTGTGLAWLSEKRVRRGRCSGLVLMSQALLIPGIGLLLLL